MLPDQLQSMCLCHSDTQQCLIHTHTHTHAHAPSDVSPSTPPPPHEALLAPSPQPPPPTHIASNIRAHIQVVTLSSAPPPASSSPFTHTQTHTRTHALSPSFTPPFSCHTRLPPVVPALLRQYPTTQASTPPATTPLSGDLGFYNP